MKRDDEVRMRLYALTMERGTPPSARDVAESLAMREGEVRESFRRLADAHIVVLQRDGDELLMAAPWSAVPTAFPVEARGLRGYGNCMWDALGIAAALDSDARIDTSCADCGTAAVVEVRDGEVHGEGLVHFALPVRQWWDDVVFT